MIQSNFLSRLQKGEILVADGSTGATLYSRGLEHGKPAEAWLFERPEEITRLHQDFINSGSDIILTNTFGGSSILLESAGLAGRAIEVNIRAAELARQAVKGTNVLVAGSMGPCGQLLKPYGPLEEEKVLDSFTEQAKALAESGVDLLVIETHFDIKEAILAFKGTRSVSTLPVVVSFSYDRGTRSMMGVKPAEMAAEFASLGADVLGVNCGRSLEENLKALQELRQATTLPIWFKPNAGLPKADFIGHSIYKVTPEQMGALTPQWISAGAQVVGGCCGTSPEHLREIARNARGQLN